MPPLVITLGIVVGTGGVNWKTARGRGLGVGSSTEKLPGALNCRLLVTNPPAIAEKSLETVTAVFAPGVQVSLV